MEMVEQTRTKTPALMTSLQLLKYMSPHQQQNKKPQKKKVTMDPTPIRPPVKIHNEKNEPVQLVFRNADLKVSNCFRNDRNRRQDSRTRFTGGLHRAAWKVKMVTDDDVAVGIRSREKKSLQIFTTDTEFRYQTCDQASVSVAPPWQSLKFRRHLSSILPEFPPPNPGPNQRHGL